METKSLSFEQMESLEGGMSCAWAVGGLLLAGGVFTFATAGWGSLIVNSIGLGYGAYGYIESCYAGLME